MQPHANGNMVSFMVGNRRGVIVPDGTLELNAGREVLFPFYDEPRAASIIPSRPLSLGQNALLLEAGEGWILFETGTSSTPGDRFAGELPTNLDAIGIDQSTILGVVPTHGHRDHVGGIVNPEGRPNYPEATVLLASPELEFWLDESRLSGTTQRSAIVARANLLPIRDRIKSYSGETEILSGINALPSPGHTIAHSCFLIEDNGQLLFLAGDLAHHPCQIEAPEIATRFDFDAEQAIGSRRRLLSWLASNRIMALFYHFDGPGLGHVEAVGTGFRFLPWAGTTP
jgi:glyoxylase-like metal-dependent hydrolase (beta-lactamase superfamily II)